MNKKKSPSIESLLLPSEAIAKMATLGVKRTRVPKGIKDDVPYHDIQGELVGGKLRYRCRVDIWNRLCYDHKAVSARSLAYYFSGIQWSAGKGWPVYSVRCFRSDTLQSDPFPTAKRHMLIVMFGGYYWAECLNSNAGAGNQITDIFVGANDELLGDNTGQFDFVITSYSID